jgi:hypothetical protein
MQKMVSNCCNQNTQAHASSDAFAELMVALVLSSSVILALSVAGAMVVEFDVEFTTAVLAAGSGAMVGAVEFSCVILALSVAGDMVVAFDVEFTAAVLAAVSETMVVAVEVDIEFAAVVFPESSVTGAASVDSKSSSGVCVSVELAMAGSDVTVVLLVVLVMFVGAKKALALSSSPPHPDRTIANAETMAKVMAPTHFMLAKRNREETPTRKYLTSKLS